MIAVFLNTKTYNMTHPNDPINPTYNEGYLVKEGLSKREYFAAQAMIGLLANPSITSAFNYSEITILSVKTSDRLIKELNKTETK